MSTLTEFTTPQIEIGECIEVLAGFANNGAVISTTQGDFVLASNNINIYNRADYPDLYARLGSLLAYSWKPLGTSFSVSDANNNNSTIKYGNGLYLIGTQSGKIQTSTDTVTWTTRTSGTTSAIYAFTYGNGLYVYATNGGGIGTSTDGITWTSRTSGTTSYLWDITYGNSLYVAVGYAGNVRTSTDGTTWLNRSLGIPQDLYVVNYGNGIYITAGSGGVARSSTDGITWTARTWGGGVDDIVTSLYGNGIFVFTNYGFQIRTTTDAITWNLRDFAPGATVNVYGNGGAYGKGMYILLGNNGGMQTSTDSIHWLYHDAHGLRGLMLPNAYYNNMTYGNGKYAAIHGSRANTFGFGTTPVFVTETPRSVIWSRNYDVDTQFNIPGVNMANLSLSLTTFGANSSPQYVTYMRAK